MVVNTNSVMGFQGLSGKVSHIIVVIKISDTLID